MANPEHLEILLRGVSDWNQWRVKQRRVIPNLSGADLSRATFLNTFFRVANRSADIFRDTTLRDVNLSGANLSGVNLSGVNLSGVNLSGAIFIHTNLSGANLSGVDLSDADLTRVQALETNFRGVTFTGVCIEDWHINSSTNLDEIICDYVYQKNNKQERKPSIGNFQPGDFTRLYQRAIETLDLIFQDGIDWKSFAVTLQSLNTDRKLNVEGEHNPLAVRAIEKRDDGSFVIRVDVPNTIDKAEIEAEFRKKYDKQLEAQTEQYRQQLQAKDGEIEYHRQQNTNLTNIVATLANRPININNNFMPTNESKGDTITNSGNMGIGINKAEIKESKIAGTIYEAPNSSLADAAAEIRDLLTELEKSYPTTTTSEKMKIATAAIDRIEANPDWKKRVVNAVETGGIAALEKAIDNPAGAFLKGAFEGWEKED